MADAWLANMPVVGQKRHGAEDEPRNDLHHHHGDQGEGDDGPGPVFVSRLARRREAMIVGALESPRRTVRTITGVDGHRC